MKKILLPGIFLCAAFGTKAQTATVIVTDSMPFVQKQLLLPNRVINKTTNGTVYALPQDGMPCLVPDSSAWALMPNVKTGAVKSGIMPNPYKPQTFPQTLILPPAKTTPKKKHN